MQSLKKKQVERLNFNRENSIELSWMLDTNFGDCLLISL